MTVNPFNDIKDVQIPEIGDTGQATMPNVASMKIGTGAKAFKANEEGIWLGGNRFADAPFSVDMNGNVIATSLDLSAYISKDGTGQVLGGSIVINDGSNDIVLIGLYP